MVRCCEKQRTRAGPGEGYDSYSWMEQGGTGIRNQEKDARSYLRAVAVFLLLGSCLRAKLDWVLSGEEE